jgi:hypothetical protein
VYYEGKSVQSTVRVTSYDVMVALPSAVALILYLKTSPCANENNMLGQKYA